MEGCVCDGNKWAVVVVFFGVVGPIPMRMRHALSITTNSYPNPTKESILSRLIPTMSRD
ncbi:putative ATP binding protein [Corchorus olitorius]|uniref:ATP binding protein n=1 Tax=Corchorus olitorius TaxID=93759 RepID=A0A1R3K706_9ROSI|nr:putative ATP binding protein [Corchorus olitorius]